MSREPGMFDAGWSSCVVLPNTPRPLLRLTLYFPPHRKLVPGLLKRSWVGVQLIAIAKQGGEGIAHQTFTVFPLRAAS
jgi:hypothetical protein